MSSPSGTLLFTDLANTSELLLRAGDPQAQRIFQAHHRLLGRLATAHGGREPKWLGDGFLCFFAAASDALQCAVAIQLAARRRAPGGRLAIRVGMHVGEVLGEADYFTTPVVIARRLCGAAQPGQILCTPDLRALLADEDTAFRDGAELAPADLPAPLSTCEVLFERSHVSTLLTHTAFVGRASELQQLTARLREARAGNGGLVLLSGEPGIGKTRMLEEFAEIARIEGALVLQGRCYEGEAARPYGPFVEALAEHVCTATPETLRADLGLGAAPLARLVPSIRERLPDVAEPVALQPDEERARLLDAVAQFLLALAARLPVVLILDDLHWADAASVVLLRHVARVAARNRLLLLGAYRDLELTPQQPLADTLGVLPRETTYAHVDLKGLGDDDVRELLKAVADQQAPEAFVNAIVTQTSGNPFFIREVLLHLVEEEKVSLREGGWATDLDDMGIPPGVRQVIQRRLMRLSDNTKRLLRAAAAFTGSFRYDLAAGVANLDDVEALGAIDEALAAHLLIPAVAADAFDFTHALVRHTLYAELSPPRQVRLHRRIAEAMGEIYGAAGERAAEIARHYHRSALLPGADRGVAYCLLAAERAEQSAAFAEAADYLRMALELADASDSRRPRLLGRLATALTWSLAAQQAEEVATQAAAAIAAAEGNDAAAEFLADTVDALWNAAAMQRAWSLAALGLQYLGDRRDTTWARLMVLDIQRREAADPQFPGIPIDSPERREVAARLWELPTFRHVGQMFFYAMAFRSRDDVLARAGDDPAHLFALAGEHRKTLPLLEQVTATALERGQIALAIFHLTLTARIHIACGDFASSLAVYTRAQELYERINRPPWLRAHVGNVQFDYAVLTGEGLELVLAAAEEMIRQGAAENQWVMAPIKAAAALCAAQLGRVDTALNWLAAILPAIEQAPGSIPNYPHLLAAAATTLEEFNRTDHIEIIERNLREKLVQPDFRYVGTDARMSLGMLCGLHGRVEEAAEWFAEARAIAEEQGASTLRARIDFYEARMYLRHDAPGDRKRGATLLLTALDQFQRLGMRGWARRAEAMLDSPNASADAHSALTDASAHGATVQEAKPAAWAGDVIFRHEGDSWILAYDGTTGRLKDVNGLHYLAHLLRHPSQEFHVLELIQSADANAPRDRFGDILRNAGPLLDAQAKAEYRNRLVELRSDLEEAEQFNDSGRGERLRAEIEAITEHLAAAVGLGGRDRAALSATERARSTVTQRIRDAIKRIAMHSPGLADHLADRIRTGTFCVYRPDAARRLRWTIEP